MADEYVVNNKAQPNGDHEVHKKSCHYLPSSYTALGSFTECSSAVRVAKAFYNKSNGCAFCSSACHTG